MTWEEINKKRLPFIRMGERLFKGMYNEIKIQLKEVIKDRNTPEEITEAIRTFRFDDQIVQSAFMRYYVKTGLNFAKDTKNRLLGREQKDDDYDTWMAELVEYIRTKTGTKITSTISTAYKDIESISRAAIEMGMNEGWGMDKIVREIVKGQGKIDAWKAMRIARTEVVSASNLGVEIGAESLVGNKKRIWISTFRPTSRPDHLQMDGVIIPYNEKFLTPKGNYMSFPGDPECDDASDTINCTCGYEVIVESDLF